MKIINKYVLKEHVGPFVFALSALTSLLLLQYIARRFGDLVGKGLPWQVIVEFFTLAIPFTVAMTLPMAVLVAVLYAFSRLAAENEITAIKAGGISSRRLMIPSLAAATVLAIGMLLFNDQVLPRSNHRLAGLMLDIARTKPTFALREQVINAIREGQLYLRAGHIDEATSHLRDVVIYDLLNERQRRTIYAETGVLALSQNQRDLTMRLYNGMMLSVASDKSGKVTRVDFEEELLKVREVAGTLNRSDADTLTKAEREMSVCEMQREFDRAVLDLRRAQSDYARMEWRVKPVGKQPTPVMSRAPAGGIGAVYCNLVAELTKRFSVKHAQAAEVQQDTSTRRRVPPPHSATATNQAISPVGTNPVITPVPVSPPPKRVENPPAPREPPREATELISGASDLAEAKIRLQVARRQHNRYGVEIEKKFSLAAACIVFVLVGAPIALRFPHGGVGLVIGVSFVVFATYYVGLIGGEELANRGIITPFWAMWGANVVFLAAGLFLITRMGRESATTRGGGQLFERLLLRFSRKENAA